MAEKLAESTWTGFVKKQKLELDDKPLVKALTAFDKADESKPEARLAALDEVVAQIPEQVKGLVKRKKELGDKRFGEVKDKLYALLEEAEALQKKARAAVAAAAAAEKDDDEEADTPALLTTKMVPLLRALRDGKTRMHALICTAGKNTAVLVMRKTIPASRRKLLAEAVDAKSGMKYVVGECMFENKTLTFTVQSSGSQLAKRVRQALLDQTEMRFKVKVTGDDGVEEHDGDDEGDEQAGVQGSRSAPSGGPASAEQVAYVQRLRKLRERYDQALKDQHPESTKLRALMGFASEKADGQKDYVAASRALESLEKLLDAPVTRAGSGSASGSSGAGDADDAVAGWQVARTTAVASLKSVASKVAAARHASSARAIVEINELMKKLNATPDRQQQVAELQRYLREDAVVSDICELVEDIRSPMLRALDRLQTQLTA